MVETTTVTAPDAQAAPAPATVEPAKVEAPASIATPAVPAAPDKPEPTIRETLSATFDALHSGQPRDEGGRFISDKPSADAPVAAALAAATKVSDHVPDAKPVEQARPAIDAPASWSADVKAKWQTLPPDVQEYVARRESETHKAITQLGQQAKAYEPIRAVVEQHGDIFTRNGVRPDEGIARLLTAQRVLDNDPVSGIRQIAEAYGVDLASLALGSQPAEPNAVPDALQRRIDAMEARNRQLEQQVNGFVSRQAEHEAQALANLIDEFSKGKDDWSMVEPDVTAQIYAITHANPGLSHAEILSRAYDNATRINPEAVKRRAEREAAELKARAEKEAAAKAADARRIASINVKGSPTSVSAGGSIRDTLREIADRAYGR